MKHGIDISYAQGQLDWSKIVKENEGMIDFAIIRAGYGQNNIDAQAHHNASTFNALNIPIGLYWFSYAYTDNMAREEAKYILNFASKYKVEFPIFFDFEYASKDYAKKKGYHLTAAQITSLAENFCQVIEANKYYASIYTNKDYKNNIFTKSLLERYDHWLAYYTQQNKPTHHLQQYTAKGKLKNTTCSLDFNWSKRDYPTIIKNAHLNNL